MRTIEGQVRDLLREFGDQVPQDGAPPLRLPGGQAGYADSVAQLTELPPLADQLPTAPGSRRLHRKLAPVAAAAAVLAIAVAGAAIAAGAHKAKPDKPAAHTVTTPGNVPPYYVSLEYVPGTISSQKGAIEIAVVRSTTTGKALATVQVPKSWRSFIGVTAAADDKTFVLAADRPWTSAHGLIVPSATKFYELTINPMTANKADLARLVALRAPVEPKGIFFRGFALSPDGSKLAVSLSGPDRVGQVSPAHVQIVSLATGRVRMIATKAADGEFGGLSWESDSQTLALAGSPQFADRWEITLVRTGAGSHGRGRVVLRLSSPYTVDWRGLTVTPDGRTAIATKMYENKKRIPLYIRVEEYDIATGKLRTIIDKHTVRLGAYSQLAWSNPSGQVLVEIYVSSRAAKGPGLSTDRIAAILVGHQYHQIPWPRRAITGAW